MRSTRSQTRISAILAALTVVPLSLAADKTWLAAVSGDWTDASKWDAGVPTASDNAIINVAGTYVVTVKGNQAAANLTLGAGVTLRIEGATGDATLTVTNGFTNPGTIELTNSSLNRGATLVVTNGTLTNTNTIDVLSGAGTTILLRTLNCQLDNQGTLNVGDDTALTKSGAAAHANSGTINITGGDLSMTLSSDSFTNTNAITIGAGRKLDVTAGTFNQNAGSIAGTGTLAFSGGVIANFQTSFSNAVTGLTMTQTTFNSLGGATLTNANALTLQNDTINGPFDNQGALTVKSQPNTIGSAAGTFAHQSGAKITISGDPGLGDATLTVTNGFTNPGTIELTNTGLNRGANLVVTNGTLTNTNTIDVLSGAGTTILLRTLNCQLDNQGALNVGDDTALSKTGAAAHTNSGTINITGGDLSMTLSSDSFTNTNAIDIGGGRKLDVVAGTFNQNAGSISGAGTLAFSGGAIANFQTSFSNAVTGLTMTQTTFNSLGGATLTNANALTLKGDTINGPFTNLGALTVKQINTIGSAPGAFLQQAGAKITIIGDGTDGNGQLTVTNGFTNAGTMELTNASPSWPAILTVTNGTLTNAHRLDILTGSGGVGTLRSINARLDNQGTFNLDFRATLSKASVTHSNSGTMNLKSTLTVQSGSFQQSAGALNLTFAGTALNQFGRLETSAGGVALDAALGIAIDGAYMPVDGHAFEIVSAGGVGTRSGDFDAITGQQITATQEMQVCYGPKNVRLTVVPLGTAFASCDTDCNGTVNPFDIQPFLNLLSGSGVPCGQCVGDTNGDGTVNPFDINGFINCLAP